MTAYPERVVHARGSAAHGVFKLHEDMSEFTKGGFLADTSRETPVFVRFSRAHAVFREREKPRKVSA